MIREAECFAALPVSLIEENHVALSQLCDFLADLSPADYRQPFGSEGRHSLGRHVRHIIDHYEAFLAGLDDGHVDYEQRRREARLEEWPSEAVFRLREIASALDVLSKSPTAQHLALDYRLGDGSIRSLTTSLARELAFLTSHTIHHMALLGLLAEAQDQLLPPTFGVHPSTLRHWEQEVQHQGMEPLPLQGGARNS